MILGREGSQYRGSIKLVSRRLPSRQRWWGGLTPGYIHSACWPERLRWFCQKPHKDADVGSWKWLEDTEELSPEHQLHNQIHTHCADHVLQGSVQFSSVAQLCPTLCDPMNCSMPGLPVHHHLPEFAQTHVHRVGDAIQPSHPLSSPSASGSFPMSQLFT